MHFTFPKNPREMWALLHATSARKAAARRLPRLLAGRPRLWPREGCHVFAVKLLHPPAVAASSHLHNTSWVADCSLQFLQQRDKSRPLSLIITSSASTLRGARSWISCTVRPETAATKRPEDYESVLLLLDRSKTATSNRDQGAPITNLIGMIRGYTMPTSASSTQPRRLISYLADTGDLDNTADPLHSDHGESSVTNSFG